MDTYKKYKVRLVSGSTWISSAKFKVIENEFEIGRNKTMLKEIKVFEGTISDCHSYLQLVEDNRIE